ncbi:DinB family protein [Rhizosphaericola mali]|uniref:DinB family protein n=1 Tax=Rhizosphaericola mali TaxID=2545455 RepID=A0A5P2G2Y3_9BACT|nr:DinB family protein [Rhizosphaericola mali]QES87473.1 DinB family protein [Rhizosphaericola mali]
MGRTEVWLRNEKIENLDPILQPAANALLEAKEELSIYLNDFPESKLWTKPAGCASIGFHLKHISGFLDRLLTYADGKMLDENQLDYLSKEEFIEDIQLDKLLSNTINSIENTVEHYKSYPISTFTESRYVGRNKIPTTTIGLLFHAAEHTMRHIGQILVTSKILKDKDLSI